MPAISIIICTYNRAEYLPEALLSLYNQTLAKDLFEVIIVNNNSSDNTILVCEKFIASHTNAAFYLLNETEQGASYARNTGAAIAKASLLCFMDDDAVAYSDYLQNILNFFANYTGAGGLGGRIIPRYIPTEPKWMSKFVASLVGDFHYSESIKIFSANKYPLESNMIVHKADFNAVGGFNTALPGVKGTIRIGGEGKDFFLKLKAMGRIIYYDPSVVVEHIVETKKLTPEYLYRVASGVGRGERIRTKAIGEFDFMKKILEYWFKLGASIILSLFYLLQGQPAKMKPVIQFRIDALKGLLNY
ncbi:MAG: glycosyltransferase family 2 protein [Sphingobacteriia bacterium]|nr:MAG: glycosyltransferase family 2 protein [Sphingobacteriia bacterium]TAG31202.1 MAG: glycosyltransferase family 2 protein [Sphingobacteriia bacterium]